LDALRDGDFRALRDTLSSANMEGAARCAVRLHATLPEPRHLDRNVVMVAYGGGKDSSYTVAFVRLVQLILYRIHGATFTLRPVTNRHAGMPRAVMENVDRAYHALGIHEDPQCEPLLVDGDRVLPFRLDEPLHPDVVARNRLDLLMTGHLTHAEARPTFCNACNLSMVNAFGVAASHGQGVDVIITGDSPREQRAYYLWVNRLARRFGDRDKRPADASFGGFLRTTDDIARAYFTDIYGDDADDLVAERRVAHDVPDRLRFFSIYDDTAYSASEHWRLLADHLGFQFDEIAFSFTESDCGNPTLMAHLRGLRQERLYGRGYDEGLQEYVRFATSLMARKEFPPALIETMRARYAGAGAAERMRAIANAFAREAYGLDEEQLVCMVYSPLPAEGSDLERYLSREQPQLAERIHDVHALLAAAGEPAGDAAELAGDLERVSGLPLARLRTLYQSPRRTLRATGRPADLMSAVLAGDPHKDVIETRHAPDGPVVRELLSGR